MTKHEEKKQVYPTTQEVHENDIVDGADPGNTNIITIAVPKRAEDGIEGNLCQKDMHQLNLSREGYHRESGILNAREK